MLKPGELAPDFELPDADMDIARLSDYKGKQHVVLYFYVRDDTPGCTTQAVDFSDLDSRFAKLDAVVLGVSRDDCMKHAQFRDKHGITVRLLADKDCIVCRQYGVMINKEVDGVMKDSVQRSTFIIDKGGVIRQALYGVQAKGHAEQVLKMLKEL